MNHAFESPYYPIEQGLPAAHTAMIVFSVATSWQFPSRLLACAQFLVEEMPRRKRKHVKRIRANNGSPYHNHAHAPTQDDD